MLKYQNLLNHLSLEEKIKLVTSSECIKNRQINDYVFPNLEFISDLKDIIPNFIMPSYNSLGATYDVGLISDFAREVGKYLASTKLNKIVNVPINPLSDTNPIAFSSSRLVSAKLGSAFAAGIEEGGQFSSYGVIPCLEGIDLFRYFNDDLYSYKVAFSNYKPFAAILSSSDTLDTLNGDYRYDGLKAVISKNDSDFKNSINHNSTLSIYENKNNVELIKEAVEKYESLVKQLKNEEISNAELTAKINSGEAINPYTIDEMLDELLDKLAKVDNLSRNEVQFDFAKLEELEYKISQSSVVLLKNDNDILPMKREKKVSFIGNQLFKPKFNTNTNVNVDILKLIDGYHLETQGIAHGYVKGQKLSDEVVNQAIKLINESEYSFIFLDVEDNKIPEEEVEFLNRIASYKESIKIVPILFTNTFVDMTPLLQFDAILVNMGDSKSMIHATFDVITGKYNPTGRLPFAVKSDPFDKHFKSLNNLIYPLGFGLNYSKFNYTSINIDEGGIILAVKNNSNVGGTDKLFFTSEYLSGTDKENNIIRDFITLYLEPHESKIVEFKFNFNSFSVYLPDKDDSLIREGKYNVQLLLDFNDILSEKELTLKQISKGEVTAVELDKAYDNLDSSLKDFVYDVKPKKIVSTRFKLLSLISISLYVIALLVVWFFFTENLLPKIILMSLCGVILVVDLILIIIIVKRSRIRDDSKIEALKDVLNNIGEFDTISHKTFIEPIPELPNEEEDNKEIIDDLKESVEEEKEEIKYIYDNNGEPIIDENEYDNDSTFEDIVNDFVKYSLNSGLIIESKDARELFASMMSSNLVLINNKTDDLNTRLLEVLNSYLGNDCDVIVDVADISDSTDIYWVLNENGEYVISDFTNNLIRACNLPKRLNMFVFRHATMSQLKSCLNEFVEFAKAPKLGKTIDIGDGHEISIPENTVFFALIDDPAYLEEIDTDISNLTTSITLLTRVNEIEKVDLNLKYNSYQYFEFLLRNARETHYLNEEIWKKIDDFTENDIFTDFYIDSRTLNVCEKIISVILASSGDSNDALNTIFKMRVIPMLKRTKAYSENHGDRNIIELIEKTFEDRLDGVIEYLKKHE